MTDRVDPSHGQFIDPMFAVVIAAAVTETAVQWTKDGINNPSWFELLIVILGFFNLLLSWFGYHKSIVKKPIKGSLRFIITVALLPLYLFTIILYAKPFYVTASVYALVFFLWSLWEYFKYIEYGSEQGLLALQFRFYNLIVFIVTAGLWIIESVDYFKEWQSTADLIGIAGIGLAVISLRIVKSDGANAVAINRIKQEIYNLCFGKKEDC